MRDERTDSGAFRAALHELTTMLVYEATRVGGRRVVPDHDAGRPTPTGYRVANPPLLVPVLRAGLGMSDAALALLPESSMGFVGLARDEETFAPRAYLESLPDGPDRHPGDRARPDAGHRRLAGALRPAASSSAAAPTSPSSACSPRRRASPGWRRPACRCGWSPPPSTSASTTGRSSCPASATPATASSAACPASRRSDPPAVAGWSTRRRPCDACGGLLADRAAPPDGAPPCHGSAHRCRRSCSGIPILGPGGAGPLGQAPGSGCAETTPPLSRQGRSHRGGDVPRACIRRVATDGSLVPRSDRVPSASDPPRVGSRSRSRISPSPSTMSQEPDGAGRRCSISNSAAARWSPATPILRGRP